MKISYITTKEDIKKSYKTILKQKLHISDNLLKKLKFTKSVFVNNEILFVNKLANESETILIEFENMDNILYEKGLKTKFNSKFKNTYTGDNLNILYEDDYLLIVYKPPSMAIHPCPDNYENTISNIVSGYLQNQNIYSLHILTRLDKNTSGICVFAKNEYIQELFMKKKDEINFIKKYICICSGIVEENHFVIEKNIARKKNSIILREVNEDGDYAKTECFVLKRNLKQNYTILNIILHTGRTHQIRIHLSSLGHSLLGDDLYKNENEDIQKYINRQALHSNEISFSHPITNERISIICDVPEDLKKLID